MVARVTIQHNYPATKGQVKQDNTMRRRAFTTMFVGCALFWGGVIFFAWQVWG